MSSRRIETQDSVPRSGATTQTVAREVGGRTESGERRSRWEGSNHSRSLLTLVSWGATTDGAPPDDAAPQTRPSLPPGVQAGDYVKAVVKLCNQGQQAQAGPYLKAAQDFRNQLSPEDQATLDQYSQMLTASPATAGAGVGGPDPAAGYNPAPVGADPAMAAAPAAGSNRERAVALVAAARQAMASGQLAQAQQYAEQANALAVPFSANEDNPARVLADLQRSRQRRSDGTRRH